MRFRREDDCRLYLRNRCEDEDEETVLDVKTTDGSLPIISCFARVLEPLSKDPSNESLSTKTKQKPWKNFLRLTQIYFEKELLCT